MRVTAFPILLSCLAVPAVMAQGLPGAAAGGAARPAFDHYDPALLNEFAIERIRRGDPDTASILLERAARLAPHDPRIRGNRDVLRAFRSGQPSPTGLTAPAARPAPESAIPAEPPALWPPK